MAEPGTPDWWLDRLYKRLRDRQPQIRLWDDWYTGAHPVPLGYEKAGPVLLRLLDTIGLNMMALVTDAALDRMQVRGFDVDGRSNDDLWGIWQDNNFDLGSEQVRQEKMALSEAYTLVDPNNGSPLLTPEHPEQCIVEHAPGSSRVLAAGLKVWQDDLGPTPVVRAMVYLPEAVFSYVAPTRVYSDLTRSALALKPGWELVANESGLNPLGEVPLVPFSNRARMLRAPVPEFFPALPIQRRINKTLMDRMSMQDAGAFKAKWATGVDIPIDPDTGQPVEKYRQAIDRMFVDSNPEAKFGQFQAEDIQQMLEAVRDDVSDCATVVPTSPDQILGKLINVSGDGLKLAQVSEVKRVRRHIRHESESWEDVGRIALKAAGKSVPNVGRMDTRWQNPEYRTDTEQANAGAIALAAGLPYSAVWERYFNATPEEQVEWLRQRPGLGVTPPTPPSTDAA